MADRKELITLNPVEVAAAGRVEINLHLAAILVSDPGIDWGQIEINAFMAKIRMGQIPIDSDWPNRVIKIPLLLGATGDFDAARIALQAEASRINEEGGWLKRELKGGDYGEAGKHLYADLVKATLLLSGGTTQASDGFDSKAELVLEALPDFYGDLVEEAAFEGTGDASKAIQVKGNLPGRVDMKVTDLSGNDQLGCGYAFRRRHYDSAGTAAWAYEAEALTPLDLATEASLTGASGGKVIKHTQIGDAWTPVLGLKLKSGEYLTHKGLYDVWARVYTDDLTSGEDTGVSLRLRAGVADVNHMAPNEPVAIPQRKHFYLVPIGQISLSEAVFGDHRWIGQIQCRGNQNGESNIYIDKVWFLCADESSGICKAPLPDDPDVAFAGYTGKDRMTGISAALNGRTADGGGGAWATSGSTGDFAVAAGWVSRKTTSDSGRRFARLGPELTDTFVRVDVKYDTAGGARAVLARYSGAGWVLAELKDDLSFRTNGVGTEKSLSDISQDPAEVCTLALLVTRNGVVRLFFGPQGEARPVATRHFSELMAGGSLEKGKPGFADENSLVSAANRYFDNFEAWAFEGDAVVFANQTARLSDRGMFRQDRAGEAYGPIAYPAADLPRVPVSGPEEYPVEICVKPSRGDFGLVPDHGLDKFKVEFSYRPCWSQVPGF